MSALSVVYCRNRGIGSLLIRAQSWGGSWSHAAIVTPEGTVIEATAKHGVRETPFPEFIAHQSDYEVVRIDCPDPDAAIRFARAQVGKRYDWTAIFGFLTARNWQDDDAWECTELVEAALMAGRRYRFRVTVNRVHPTISFYAM